MDVEAVGEFQDWEVLQSDLAAESGHGGGSVESDTFEELGGDSEGIIQTNYFTLDSQNRFEGAVVSAVYGVEEGSEESDNPSWIDPGSDTRYGKKDPGSFWSDSSSDRSDDHRKLEVLEAKYELDSSGTVKLDLKPREGEDHEGDRDKHAEKFWSDSGGSGLDEFKAEELENNGDGLTGKNENWEDKSAATAEANEKIEANGNEKCGEDVNLEVSKAGEKKVERSSVWWKLPVDFLKFCVFKVSPVWTLSVAAAVVGLVILGRRLQRMKKKTRTLELKVTMDDKKISQFMSRAARLNEAFSVVKRVPVIRPALPAPGGAPWPVMSLR